MKGKEYNYDLVKKFTLTGKRKKINIFTFDILLIPCNVDNEHWSMNSVDLRKNENRAMDSLGLTITKMTRVFKFIQDEAATLGKDDLPPKKNWSFAYRGAPAQQDGVSCGVFVLEVSCRTH